MELGNGELYFLHDSSNIIRMNKSRRLGWAGLGVRVEGKGGDYRVLVEIPEGEDRGLIESSIKIDIQEVGLEGRDWIDLAHDRNRRRALPRKDYAPSSYFSMEFAS